jgi:hypothetical protein
MYEVKSGLKIENQSYLITNMIRGPGLTSNTAPYLNPSGFIPLAPENGEGD